MKYDLSAIVCSGNKIQSGDIHWTVISGFLGLVARVIRCNKCMDGDGETKMTDHFIARV